jgi:hypothetical protein
LRLGLGRNANKEGILEKICKMRYGNDWATPEGELVVPTTKRKAYDTPTSSKVLKKRPVVTAGGSKVSNVASATKEAANLVQAKAAGLTAVNQSLTTIAETIRHAEERLKHMCEAVKVDFYGALMDRELIPNDYLREQYVEYDQYIATQKHMVKTMNDLGVADEEKKDPVEPKGESDTPPVKADTVTAV